LSAAPVPAAVANALDAGAVVLISLRDRDDLFLEGRTSAGTFAGSLQLTVDDRIARELWFRCSPVESPQPWEAAGRPAVLPLMERYFQTLNSGDFSAAAACFSRDCLYSHPPYHPGEPQAEFRGREALAAEWPTQRGAKRVATEIVRCVQSGNHAFIEGVANGGSFISSIVLDDQGLICRYVAFYDGRFVPRAKAHDDGA
jgi:hypothetical protein